MWESETIYLFNVAKLFSKLCVNIENIASHLKLKPGIRNFLKLRRIYSVLFV